MTGAKRRAYLSAKGIPITLEKWPGLETRLSWGYREDQIK